MRGDKWQLSRVRFGGGYSAFRFIIVTFQDGGSWF